MRIHWSIVFVFVSLIACKKLETDPPSVQIDSPVANDTIALSDSIHLQATVSDKHLTNYKIIFYNFYSRKLLYKEEGSASAGNFILDKKITFLMNADTTVYLNILGIDQNGNTGGAGVKFYLKK